MENSTFNQSIYQPPAVATSRGSEKAPAVSTIADASAKGSHLPAASDAVVLRVSLRQIAVELNPLASTPLHDQLFNLLRKALEEDHLADVCEGRLPSLRNMSSMLGVSRETVSKAIAKLTGYGYLSAEERKRIQVVPRKGKANSLAGQQDDLDFRPSSDESVPRDGFGKNYLTDKYLKTLRRQSAKRARLELDSCGLTSFREVLCEQLRRDSNLECRAENLIVFSDFRACADFIIRLTARGRSTCVVEAPGSKEIRSILDFNSFSVVEIPVDEEGMRADILSAYGLAQAVCFVSPSMQDPLGVRLSPERAESLMSWAKATQSIIVEHSASQGFLRLGTAPLLFRLASDQDCVFAWTVTSCLKPWAQACCAVFSSGLISEARKLKSMIGGEVSISEQMALQDFILDGDLLRAQRQRELVNLEKRRRLNLAFARIFKGAVSLWRGNCGPKLVFEVHAEANASLIAETARFCGLPVRLLDEYSSNEKNSLDRRLVLDLDHVNIDTISGKIDSLESMLNGVKSR